MAQSASALTAVGTLAGGIGSLGSGVAGFFGPSVKKQLKYQKNLMQYQQQLNDESQIAAEQRQLSYSDPAFIKQRALNAGVNPSSLLGSTAANAVGSNVSIPGALPESFTESSAARIGHSLQNMANSAIGVAKFVNEISQYNDQREARSVQLEALKADVRQKNLEYKLMQEDLMEKQFNAGKRELRFAEEQKSWQRHDRAFTREMEERAYRMFSDWQRYRLEREKFEYDAADRNRRWQLDKKISDMNFAVARFDLSQREFEKQYFEEHGYYPPKGMTPSAMVKDAISSMPSLFNGIVESPLVQWAGKSIAAPYRKFAGWIHRGFRSPASYAHHLARKSK